MTPEQIQQTIISATAHWGVDPKQVKADSNFVDDLGFDSLDSIEFVMHLEEEFSIEIPDDVAEGVKTVADAVALVQRLTTAYAG